MGRIDFDFGDIVVSLAARVKSIAPRRIVWKIGAPQKVNAADLDSAKDNAAQSFASGRIDVFMDMLDSNKVSVGIGWTDEAGNDAAAPASFTATYSVSDSAILALTDNGDGTAVVAATGNLGPATVHVEVTWDSHTATGDLLITVVADMASRINVVAGTPEHV